MGQLPEPDVAVQALHRYFGLFPGVVRAEIKIPHVFSREEPIDSCIPSSLDDVTATEKLSRQAVEATGSILEASRQLVDATLGFRAVQAVGEEVKALKDAIDFEIISLFDEVDFEEITENARVAGRELGERGWLVGPLMTPQELSQVLEGDTDQFMKERYPVDHLIGMVEESDKSRWQRTILETIHSYQDGRYRMVVLSLLPAIEALVRERVHHRVDTDERGSITKLNKEASQETEARAKEEAFLLAASEASIFGFIEQRWSTSELDMLRDDPSELDSINRHWVAHGADDPERWEPVDAHRLLQVAAVLAHEEEYRDTADER